VLLPAVGFSFSAGAPDSYTGAPGEETCLTCHDTFPLNSGPGTLTIAAPAEYQAGETYEITVTLEHTGQTRWGFEFTPLDIGTCAITDPTNTQQSASGGNCYVKQTAQGTYNGDGGPVSWSFDWSAPADPPDDVTFYAAGNAADGGGTTSGDYVYTSTATSVLASTGAEDGPTAASLRLNLSASPNPIRDHCTITYSLPRSGRVELAVYDGEGALVATLASGVATAGGHRAVWEGTNSEGTQVPAGLYVCRLSALGQTATGRLVVIR
jgi:hypothetical protein